MKTNKFELRAQTKPDKGKFVMLPMIFKPPQQPTTVLELTMNRLATIPSAKRVHRSRNVYHKFIFIAIGDQRRVALL